MNKHSAVATYYQRVGGEPGVRALVTRFYELMDTLPEVADIRALHPQDLTYVKETLFEFLSGWLGGPALYVEKYGHPRLRRRHLGFAIGIRERDQWLLCMQQAMNDIGLEQPLQQELYQNFYQIADHLRNQPNE